MSKSSGESKSPWWKDALLAVGCLLLVLGFLFRESFEPEKVVFANDAPLGAIQSHAFDEKVGGWSYWHDLNWVGGEMPSAMPNFTKGFFELCLLLGEKPVDAKGQADLQALTGPVLFAKFYQPVSLGLLGFCAWLFFRSLKFSQPVCILGGLALALNGDLFSYTVWGLPSGALGAAGALLAMAAVINGLRESGWRMIAWVILGGMALGQGVMESYDVGGIFSLYVAVFVIAAAINRENVCLKTLLPAGARGVGVLAVLALASVLMAGHVLSNLLRTEGGAAARAKEDAAGQFEAIENIGNTYLERIATDSRLSPNQKSKYSSDVVAEKKRILKILKEDPFDGATQWCVPPLESLRMVVPGLYGFRENPHGWMIHPVDAEDRYWGRVGQSPGFMRVQSEHPAMNKAVAEFRERYRESERFRFLARGFMLRHGSSGIYMGVLVLIVALWGLLQAGRGADSVFEVVERRWIFFWAALALISLLLAWGHHAPFYALIYKLPFFNIIRNPIKFMHPCGVAVVVLFAYGLQGMARAYVENRRREEGVGEQFKLWLRTLKGWEMKWAVGMLGMLAAGIFCFLIFWAVLGELERHLVSDRGFTAELSGQIASGSLMGAGLAVVFLAAALGMLTVLISGVVRARLSVLLWLGLGVVLVVDLAVGSVPHLVYYNYQQKYASNEVVDILKKRPFEQRVRYGGELVGEELRLLDGMQSQLAQQYAGSTNAVKRQEMTRQSKEITGRQKMIQYFNKVFQTDWKQALFPFYRIHSADIIQDPRPDSKNTDFRRALNPLRLWALTSTKYLLGNSFVMAKDMDVLLGTTNQFTVRARFDLVPIIGRTNGYTALVSEQGRMALLEFDGALPRAGVFANWRSGLSDDAVLAELPRTEWDPHREVLISEKIPAPESTDANATVVAARYLSYDPKRIVIETDAETSTVLLLNDKHHREWTVTVDGQPAKLLRANYLMRGVHLPRGKHKVEFRFEPEQGSIKVSFAGFGLGALAFLGLLFLPKPPADEEEEIVIEVPPLDGDELKAPSDDQEISTARDTSSPDEQPKTSRRKSRSRSGRRKKR